MTHSDALRLFVSIPEELVERPMIYEMIKQFDVIPSIRCANVEHGIRGEVACSTTVPPIRQRSPTSVFVRSRP